jgi:hypothetical protein
LLRIVEYLATLPREHERMRRPINHKKTPDLGG